MDNPPPNGHEPTGNSGKWYLDLLGVEQAPPSPRRGAGRSLTAETMFVLDDGPQSASMPTPLEATGGMPAVPAPAPAEPWAVPPDARATGDELDLRDWRPEGLAKQVESKRNFRWSIVVTLVIIFAIVITGLLWLPTTVRSEAAQERDAYRTVLDAMRATLPDTQQTLATATEPSTSAIDLFPLSAQLSTLDAAAREVVTRAERPLPDTLPLLSRAPLEDLQPTRDLLKRLGQDGADIFQRISDTITYRTKLDGILVYPSLPVRADPDQIDGLASEIAATLTDSSAILADLPLDPAFDNHRVQVAAAVDAFETWQTSYLDALRLNDQDATARLIQEAADLRDGVFSSLISALATVRSEVDAAIIQLNEDTTSAISSIPL